MALSIKTVEADRLARQLAASTGESITEAVSTALRERLERVHQLQRRDQEQFRSELTTLRERVNTSVVASEDPLTWDEHGLPT